MPRSEGESSMLCLGGLVFYLVTERRNRSVLMRPTQLVYAIFCRDREDIIILVGYWLFWEEVWDQSLRWAYRFSRNGEIRSTQILILNSSLSSFHHIKWKKGNTQVQRSRASNRDLPVWVMGSGWGGGGAHVQRWWR